MKQTRGRYELVISDRFKNKICAKKRSDRHSALCTEPRTSFMNRDRFFWRAFVTGTDFRHFYDLRKKTFNTSLLSKIST